MADNMKKRKTINMLDKSEVTRLAIYLNTNRDTLKQKTPTEVAAIATRELGFVVTKANVGNMVEDAGLTFKAEGGVKSKRVDALIASVAALTQRVEGYEKSIGMLEETVRVVSEDLAKLEMSLGGKIFS
jgi:hypothetical protein